MTTKYHEDHQELLDRVKYTILYNFDKRTEGGRICESQ